MPEFIVVDLISQAEAVERYTTGLSPEAIIAWLGTQGRVTAVMQTPTAYLFESSTGMQTTFWFTPDGHLIITPRDH